MSSFHLVQAAVSVALIGFFIMIPATAVSNAYIPNQDADTVTVIDTGSGNVSITLQVGRMPTGAAVSPDGSTAYVTNLDGTLSVINTTTNAVSTVHLSNPAFDIAVTPDGSLVFVTSGTSGAVTVVETARPIFSATLDVGGDARDVDVTPDGSKAYVTTGSGVAVIDIKTFEISHAQIPGGISTEGLAVSPDGSKVYVGCDGTDSIISLETATDKVKDEIRLAHGTFALAVTPDGSRLYATGRQAAGVYVIDTATNALVATVKGVGGNLAAAPDGSTILVPEPGINAVSVIDTGSNTVTATIPVGSNPVSLGKFTGTNKNLAPTTITVNSSVYVTSSDRPVTFTATVTPGSATGNVRFVIGEMHSGSAPVAGGTAVYTIPSLPPGTYYVNAVYEGDLTHAAGTGSMMQVSHPADPAGEPFHAILPLERCSPSALSMVTNLPVGTQSSFDFSRSVPNGDRYFQGTVEPAYNHINRTRVAMSLEPGDYWLWDGPVGVEQFTPVSTRYCTATSVPRFINISPPGDRHVGDKFTIYAQTNLNVDDEVLVQIYSFYFQPAQKSQSGEFSGATGTVRVTGGTDGMNTIGFDVDSSTFKPDTYLVIETAVRSPYEKDMAAFDVLEGEAGTTTAPTQHPPPGTPTHTADMNPGYLMAAAAGVLGVFHFRKKS